MKRLLFFIVPALLAINISAQTIGQKKHIQLNEKDLIWMSGVPGTLISVLEGNPNSDSLYTIRVKFPANFLIKPHWHTSNERVTVLSGSVYVGFGDKVDRNKSVKFTAGGYYVNTQMLHHYVWTDEPAEIQITGIGSWVVKYVENEK